MPLAIPETILIRIEPLLASIGWNEKDDGGLEASDKTSNGGMDYAKGDWVWKN